LVTVRRISGRGWVTSPLRNIEPGTRFRLPRMRSKVTRGRSRELLPVWLTKHLEPMTGFEPAESRQIVARENFQQPDQVF
jgi:hypothetical protein